MQTIDDIWKGWNPDSIYDITDINKKENWEYYFTCLFPERVFTVCWVGRLEKENGEYHTGPGSRLLFMERTDGRFRTFRLYWKMFTFHYMNGKIEMLITHYFSNEAVAEIEGKHLGGGDWLESVYGQPDENKEVTVKCVPRSFADLGLVVARDFTADEMKIIDNSNTQKEIDEKLKEIDALRAKMSE